MHASQKLEAKRKNSRPCLLGTLRIQERTQGSGLSYPVASDNLETWAEAVLRILQNAEGTED
jgi:hypothetical protein